MLRHHRGSSLDRFPAPKAPELTPRSHVRHSSSGSTATTSEQMQGSRRSESPESLSVATSGLQYVRSSPGRSESSVRVVLRFRPRITEEELQDSNSFCVHPSGRIVESLDGSYCFELDRAFGEATSQDQVYDYVGRPIIDDVLSGYNGTIFAYGQTSSGKTYSMFGPHTSPDGTLPEMQGVVPRAAQQIFGSIAASGDEFSEFTIRCSFLEVYKEKMKDLLRPTSEKLRVKELPQRGLYVDGLSREYVTCPSEVMGVLRAGYRARKTGGTRQNQHSSRSHAIFELHVEQRSEEGTERLGKLTLVDLAGSEKVSKSECVGETFEEARKINWSLSALGKVIDALAERRPHVPYRDSQLTRVLEEALGGNCRTTLLVAASACSLHMDETLSSLRFATRAKKVRNVAKVNFMYSSEQLLLMVAQLQRELLGAKQQIIHLGGGLPFEDRPVESSPEKAKPLRKDTDATRLRLLGASGSAPSFMLNKSASQAEEVALSDKMLIDMDEVACLAKKTLISSSSSRLVGTPPSEEISEVEAQHEADDENEAYRPLAVAARDAVWSLEAALLAQEQALEEARLLRARREDTGEPHDRISGSSSARGMSNSAADTLSERFRALRHAVDARSLHWRLQLEKHRSESLSLELEMRARYAQDLEQSLAESNSRLVSMQQDSPLQSAKASGAGLGKEMRRMPLWQRAGSSPCAATSVQASSGSGPRIKRPVPRLAVANIRFRTSSGGDHSPRDGKEAAPSPRSPRSAAASSNSPPVPPQAAPAGLASAASEGVLWVAGTGDTGGEAADRGQAVDPGQRGSETAADAASAAQLESRVQELERQLTLTKSQNEALQQSNDSLQVELKAVQSNSVLYKERIQEFSRELSSRDVRITSLRHEIRIKDALLGCLRDEDRQRLDNCDEELEELWEKALSPLAAILTREQTATAAAAGERAGDVLR